MRAFLLTAENGSASAAARIIGVSQPAVSLQLQELEKILHVKLIERVGVRMLPTAAGRALIEPVRRALAAVEQIEPTVASFREGSGLVRLGTGATACLHFLPGPLAQTRSQNPNLQILVVTGNSDEIVDAVENGSIDIGLITGDLRRSNPMIHVESLLSEDLLGVVPKSIAHQFPQTLRPQDLVPFPLILFEPAGRTRQIIDAWFKSEGVRPIPAMELGSIEAIKTMVGSGLGVSVVPRLAAELTSRNVAYRPLTRPVQRELCLAMRADKVLDAGVRGLLEQLRAAANGSQFGHKWSCRRSPRHAESDEA
ncbi:MAG: LysR family transcriptional regulator [Gemmatimonas sp.]